MQGLDCYHSHNLSSPLYRWCSACRLHTVSRSDCLRSSRYIPFPQRYRNPDNNGHRNSQGLFPSALLHHVWLRFCVSEQESPFPKVPLPLPFLDWHHPIRNIFRSVRKSSMPCCRFRYRSHLSLLFWLRDVDWYKKPNPLACRNHFFSMQNHNLEK